MRDFRINNGPEQMVTQNGRILSWKDDEAKAKHYAHMALYWEAIRKKEALAKETAESGIEKLVAVGWV